MHYSSLSPRCLLQLITGRQHSGRTRCMCQLFQRSMIENMLSLGADSARHRNYSRAAIPLVRRHFLHTICQPSVVLSLATVRCLVLAMNEHRRHSARPSLQLLLFVCCQVCAYNLGAGRAAGLFMLPHNSLRGQGLEH